MDDIVVVRSTHNNHSVFESLCIINYPLYCSYIEPSEIHDNTNETVFPKGFRVFKIVCVHRDYGSSSSFGLGLWRRENLQVVIMSNFSSFVDLLDSLLSSQLHSLQYGGTLKLYLEKLVLFCTNR